MIPGGKGVATGGKLTSRLLRGWRVAPDLPVLDTTGKDHGVLPHPKDLERYHVEDLTQLRDQLNASVQKRIEKTIELGADYGHNARLAEEQQLVQSLETHLLNR